MRKMMFLLLLNLITANLFAESRGVVKFASLDYCPLICDPSAEPSGYKGLMVDILELIFIKEGLKIEVSLMPYARAIKEVGDGLHDGMIGGDIFQAPHFIYPNEPLITNHAQIFSLKGKIWNYQGVDSLSVIRLLSVKAFNYANTQIDYYLKNGPRDRVIQMDGGGSYTKRAIELLMRKSADAYIDGHLIFQYIASLQGMENRFTAVSPILGIFKNYVSFSPRKKNAAKYAAIINKHLPSIKNGKEMSLILKKYGIR